MVWSHSHLVVEDPGSEVTALPRGTWNDSAALETPLLLSSGRSPLTLSSSLLCLSSLTLRHFLPALQVSFLLDGWAGKKAA